MESGRDQERFGGQATKDDCTMGKEKNIYAALLHPKMGSDIFSFFSL